MNETDLTETMGRKDLEEFIQKNWKGEKKLPKLSNLRRECLENFAVSFSQQEHPDQKTFSRRRPEAPKTPQSRRRGRLRVSRSSRKAQVISAIQSVRAESKTTDDDPEPIMSLDFSDDLEAHAASLEQSRDTSPSSRISTGQNRELLTRSVKKLSTLLNHGPRPRFDQVTTSFIGTTGYRRSRNVQDLYEESISKPDEMHCSLLHLSDDLDEAQTRILLENICRWIVDHDWFSVDCLDKVETDMSGNSTFAECPIQQLSVIGQVIGDEMLESEFYEIYEGTFSFQERRLKGWIFEVDDCMVFLDSVGRRRETPNFVKSIRDVRDNLEKESNVGFVTVKINGWPCVFCFAKETIDTGEELLTDNYSCDEYQKLHQHVTIFEKSLFDYQAEVSELLAGLLRD